MATRVFVSAGTPGNQAQAAFRDAIVTALAHAGLAPRLMDELDWDYERPFRGVRRAMDGCHGVVVIAYARYEFQSGVETGREGVSQLDRTTFPTAWNQIEAAMAYERGLPLLIIAEKGLKQDAFLNPTGDAKPLWVDPDPGIAGWKGFHGYVNTWKVDVEEHAVAAAEGTAHPGHRETSFRQLIYDMPWYELVGFVATLAGALLAAVTIGYRAGTGQWPFG